MKYRIIFDASRNIHDVLDFTRVNHIEGAEAPIIMRLSDKNIEHLIDGLIELQKINA